MMKIAAIIIVEGQETRVYVLKEAKQNKTKYLNHAINLKFNMFWMWDQKKRPVSDDPF